MKLDLPRAIQALYEAVPQADRWPAALAHMRDVFHTDVASLMLHDVAGREGARFQIGYDPGGPNYFEYAAVNPLLKSIVHKSVGVAHSDHMLVDRSELVRSAFFNEYALPHSNCHFIGLPITRSNGRFEWLSLARSEHRQAFGATELRGLQALLPHLRCTILAWQRLGQANATMRAAETVMNSLQQAIVLLDQRGKLLYANQAAERIVAERDGLTLQAGGLQTPVPSQTTALHDLVARAARGYGELGRSGGHIALRRRSGKPPLSVIVVPLPLDTAWRMPSSPAVAVLISDASRVTQPTAGALRRVFGLTPREAELTIALTAGDTLQQLADRLGIGRETARTHLARALQKCGVTRQSDLVRLAMNLAGAQPTYDNELATK